MLARRDVGEMRAQHVIELVLERHDGAGEAENQDENTGGEREIEMNVEE